MYNPTLAVLAALLTGAFYSQGNLFLAGVFALICGINLLRKNKG